jgi:hypothetical protein
MVGGLLGEMSCQYGGRSENHERGNQTSKLALRQYQKGTSKQRRTALAWPGAWKASRTNDRVKIQAFTKLASELNLIT